MYEPTLVVKSGRRAPAMTAATEAVAEQQWR